MLSKKYANVTAMMKMQELKALGKRSEELPVYFLNMFFFFHF